MTPIYDHREEPAYYPRPEDISDEEWEKCWATMNRYSSYMGPRRDGVWTVEPIDKAVKWRQRRRAGIPYIHRISCGKPIIGMFGDIGPQFCWALETDGGSTHWPTFTDALMGVEQSLRMDSVQRALSRIEKVRREMTKLGVEW